MAKKIEIRGNYLYINNEDLNSLFDKSIANVEIRKKTINGDTYSVYYNDACVHGLAECRFDEFYLDGVQFATNQEFEDWKNNNTAGNNGGSNATLQDVVDELQLLNTSNNQINANLQSIEAVNTAIQGFVDGLESGQLITQSKLDDLLNAINSSNADQVNELQNIISFVDGLEAGQTVTNGLLNDISGFVDNLEALTQTLIDEVDQVEELLTTIRDTLFGSDVNQPIDNDVNTSIPAGFRSVMIGSLSGVNNINLGNAVNYQLGNGRRQDGLILSGEQMGFKNGILPAINITGGTWQWIALGPLP